MPVRWLHAHGISSALGHRYVRSGWLEALPGQAYLRPGIPLAWPAAVYAAQQVGQTVHVSHLSALAVQGLGHYQPLGQSSPLHLYMPGRTPAWLAGLPFSVTWHRENVIDEDAPGKLMASPYLRKAAVRLPVSRKLALAPVARLMWPVYVSTPECAALELAAWLTRGDSWDTAYETFSGLSMLRPLVVRELLLACTRVVTRRIFLHLAQRSNHAWWPHLDLRGIDPGQGDRQVMPGGQLDSQWHITVPRQEPDVAF